MNFLKRQWITLLLLLIVIQLNSKSAFFSFFILTYILHKMTCQLPADCLNEIFECLEDNVALRSCLLVNQLWCKVSVRILWRTIQNYNTLIACLPNESKELFFENVQTPTSPLFNYVAFIKTLSVKEIHNNISLLQNYDDNKTILATQEVFKMLMNQIS